MDQIREVKINLDDNTTYIFENTKLEARIDKYLNDIREVMKFRARAAILVDVDNRALRDLLSEVIKDLDFT